MARPPFQPTADQRNTVEAMVGFGIPETDICEIIKNPQTGKPVDEKTLRKHFRAEIASGSTKLKAAVGALIVNTILGRKDADGLPLGLVDERARATLTVFFAKTRMGWKETVVTEHANPNGKPFIFQVSTTDAKL